MFIRTVLRSGQQWVLDHISIRLRLALWYGALLSLSLGLFSVIVFAVAQNQLEGSIDQALKNRSVVIANAVQSQLSTVPGTSTPSSTPVVATPTAPTPSPVARATAISATPSAPTPTPTAVPSADPAQIAKVQQQLKLSVPAVLQQLDISFEVLDNKGAINYPDPKTSRAGLPLNQHAIALALNGGCPQPFTERQGSTLLRIYVYPITRPPEGVVHTNSTNSDPANCVFPVGTRYVGAVVVVKALDDVNSSLDTLRRLLVVGGILAVLFTSLGGWLIAGQGLEPITSVTRTARAIAINAHGAGLGRRVGYSGPRDEVGELASTFDDMLAAVERVARAQQRFVADASHELRAPLTTIKGSLEFLRRAHDLPEDERRAVVEDAYTEAERMAGLVNDLLLLARADAATNSGPGSQEARLDDQMRGRREMVEVDQLALDIFRHGRAQLQARHRGQTQIAIENLEPVAVMADPSQLRQVLLILLDNAIKYTPSGGKVRISVTRQGSRAAISISDSGIGIPPEIRPHIFERFYRGDQARERDQHGSGLGLAIAKWLVEAHNGEISVLSQPGTGSTFTVLLPAIRRPGEQGTTSKQLAVPRTRNSRSVMAGAILPLTRFAATASRPHLGKQAEPSASGSHPSPEHPAPTHSGEAETHAKTLSRMPHTPSKKGVRESRGKRTRISNPPR